MGGRGWSSLSSFFPQVRGQRLREVLAAHCPRACCKDAERPKQNFQPGVLPLCRPQPSCSLSPHLVHTAEQLPVESGKVVGHVLRLPAMDLRVSRGDLDLLRKGHLVGQAGAQGLGL